MKIIPIVKQIYRTVPILRWMVLQTLALIVIAMLYATYSCTQAPPPNPPRFKGGDIVLHRLTGDKGIIQFPSSVNRYEYFVRFPNPSVSYYDQNPFTTVLCYEYELDSLPVTLPQGN